MGVVIWYFTIYCIRLTRLSVRKSQLLCSTTWTSLFYSLLVTLSACISTSLTLTNRMTLKGAPSLNTSDYTHAYPLAKQPCVFQWASLCNCMLLLSLNYLCAPREYLGSHMFIVTRTTVYPFIDTSPTLGTNW